MLLNLEKIIRYIEQGEWKAALETVPACQEEIRQLRAAGVPRVDLASARSSVAVPEHLVRVLGLLDHYSGRTCLPDLIWVASAYIQLDPVLLDLVVSAHVHRLEQPAAAVEVPGVLITSDVPAYQYTDDPAGGIPGVLCEETRPGALLEDIPAPKAPKIGRPRKQ